MEAQLGLSLKSLLHGMEEARSFLSYSPGLSCTFSKPGLVGCCGLINHYRTNNIVNTYSAGLSIQALGRPFAKIPRFLWTFVCFAIYTVIGIVGREHFSTILTNFLSILGYWTAWFIVIVMEEHFIFRRKGGTLGGYELNDWDSPSRSALRIHLQSSC